MEFDPHPDPYVDVPSGKALNPKIEVKLEPIMAAAVGININDNGNRYLR